MAQLTAGEARDLTKKTNSLTLDDILARIADLAEYSKVCSLTTMYIIDNFDSTKATLEALGYIVTQNVIDGITYTNIQW